ncbi:MAG: hypothetical protein AAFP81_01100 [Pseudomonadota bacterium]
MDTVILAIVALAALCSFVFCTMQLRATITLAAFSWIIAIPWLGVYSVRTLSTLDGLDILEWQGNAEMGIGTLIFCVIGLSLVATGGKRNVVRR